MESALELNELHRECYFCTETATRLTADRDPDVEIASVLSCLNEMLNNTRTRDKTYEHIKSSLSYSRQISDPEENRPFSIYDLFVLNLTQLNSFEPEKVGAHGELNSLNISKLERALQFEISPPDPYDPVVDAMKTICYLTAAISIVLNLIVIIVLCRAKENSNDTRQTRELRAYLINLAVSDLALSHFLPTSFKHNFKDMYWDLPVYICRSYAFSVKLTFFSSVCTIIAIGFSRYNGILNPLGKYREKYFTAKKVIVGIWLVGIVVNLPLIAMYDNEPFCRNDKLNFKCKVLHFTELSFHYDLIIYIITFVVPTIFLFYLFMKTKKVLLVRELPGEANLDQESTVQRQRIKAIKMLSVVLLLFVIFWFPLQLFWLVLRVCPKSCTESLPGNTLVDIYLLFRWLAQGHSCLNPVIYYLMSSTFRQDLIKTIPSLTRFPYFDRQASNDLNRRNLLRANKENTNRALIELIPIDMGESRLKPLSSM